MPNTHSRFEGLAPFYCEAVHFVRRAKSRAMPGVHCNRVDSGWKESERKSENNFFSHQLPSNFVHIVIIQAVLLRVPVYETPESYVEKSKTLLLTRGREKKLGGTPCVSPR